MPDYTAGKARILLEPHATGFFAKARSAIKSETAGKDLSQKVRLRADAAGFYTGATNELRDMRQLHYDVRLRPNIGNRHIFRSDAQAQVKSALAGMHNIVDLNVHVNTTKATADMLAWRRAQEAVPLRIKVITDRAGSNVTRGHGVTEFRRSLTPQSQPQQQSGALQLKLDDQFDYRLRQRVAKAVDGINNSGRTKIKPGIDASSLSWDNPILRRQAYNLQRDFENSFKLRIQPNVGGIQLRLPLGALGFEVIPGAVAALGELVGALHQLSGAALTIPGALAAAGTSIGTFALGISGIADAWKAMADEEKRAASQTETDAQRMERAHNSLRNAQVDARNAQRDLTEARRDARRELEDLHAEERSTTLSVAEAAIELQRARNELAKTPAGGLERSEALVREARAQENLDGAIQRQRRTREDLNDAQRKGVEGSDQVVSAQEALIRSNQQVAETLRQIQLESSGAANSQGKIKYFMDQLSPTTQHLVNTLFGLRGEFQDLKNLVETNMFQGLAAEMSALAETSLPNLRKGLGGVASGINENLLQITQTLRGQETQDLFSRIFGNTEEFHRRFTAAIDPMITGLSRLSAAGSDALPRLATGFGHLMERFANFIETADRDGRLDLWIDRGIEGIQSLGRTIGNLGGIINGISRAFGGNLIGGLENATRKLSEFLNSGRGQRAMLDFIQGVRDTITEWRPILEDLPAVFNSAMDAGRAAIQALLPLINLVSEGIEHMPWLIQGVVTAFVGWSAIKPIMSATGLMITGLGALVTDLGTGFALTRGRAQEATSGIDAAFAAAGREGGGIHRTATRVSRFAQFMTIGGPFVAAIATAGFALSNTLVKAHNDAAEAAKAHQEVEENLARTLERVSGAAGAATLAEIARQMEEFAPAVGLGGNVRQAVEQLGINPTEFATSTLPGGEGARAGYFDQFREAVRPVVRDTVKGNQETLTRHGADENTIVDAFLGDQEAIKRLRAAVERANLESQNAGTGPFTFNLGQVQRQAERTGGPALAAALAGQFLASQSAGLISAQQAQQGALQTQTGQKAQPELLGPNGSMFNRPGVIVKAYWDGTDAQLDVTNLPEDLRSTLEARNNQVNPPFIGPNGMPVTKIILTEEDRKAILGFAAGGPTPTGTGKGPTGGHIIEAHPDEWVLPKHARQRLGDDWLWAVTQNKGIPRRGSYFLGGPPMIPLQPFTWGGGSPAPAPAPPPAAPPPAPVPGEGGVGVNPAASAPMGPLSPTGPLPGPPPTPSMDPAAVDPATGQTGVSHAGGPGVPFDATTSTAPILDPAGNVIYDPATGAQQPQTPDFGTALANQFLGPWGFQMDPKTGQPVPLGGGQGREFLPPDQYLGEFAGNFAMAFGETLLNGVLGFFGMSTDNVYFNALKQTLGFYTDAIGGEGESSYISPETQALVDSSLGQVASAPTYYQDPSTGALIPVTSTGSPTSALPGAALGPMPQGAASTAKISTEPFKGSGVIASPSGSDSAIEASKAAAAQVLPDANIVNFLRDFALSRGLSVGAEGQAGGNPYRQEAGSLHEVGRAVDIYGTPEQMAAFVQEWNSHPELVAATRMLIYDPVRSTGGEIYGGTGQVGFNWGNQSAHGDHVHLGLEGVPAIFASGGWSASGYAIPPTGQIGSIDTTATPLAPGWYSGTTGTSGSTGSMPPLPTGPKPFRKPLGTTQRSSTGQVPRYGIGRGTGSPITRAAAPPAVTSGPGGLPNVSGSVTVPGAAISEPNSRTGISGGGQGVGLSLRMNALARMLQAPPANYNGGNPQIWGQVYRAFREAGFTDDQWPSIVELVNGESAWRPNVQYQGPVNSDAYGLFQFLGTTWDDVGGQKTDDPYLQAVYGMRYIKQRYGSKGIALAPTTANNFKKAHNWYDRGGILRRGVNVTINDTNEEEIVMRKSHAIQAKQIIDRARARNIAAQPKEPPAPPSRSGIQVPARTMAPPPPPEADIPAALPPQGVGGTPVEQAPQQNVAPAQPGSADHLHPALSKGITSTAGVLANAASTAASAAVTAGSFGAGAAAAPAAGALAAGLFQQGGKIVEGLANVGAAFASGFLNFDSTTPNAYGVQLRGNQKPPPLASDNRRIHQGNNYFASMEEWRRQNQVRDAQDTQATMARINY